MTHCTEKLLDKFSDQLSLFSGSHSQFESINGCDNCGPNDLVFVQTPEQFDVAKSFNAAVIIASESALTAEIENKTNFSNLVLQSNNIRLSQATVKQYYQDYDSADAEWPSIHPSASVHQSAELGRDCRVGPGVVIGANCIIGNGVVIRSNSVIEHDVKIGNNTIINSLANIGYACEIGSNVSIQSGVVIGNEGYGFAPDADNAYHRIPHTGSVIIHNDVHIGSNSCVDRGTYGATIINKGVKIDNLCHIAHNVVIGENTLLTAQTVVAGSSNIGKRVIASGQTGVLDHTSIADDTVLVMRAGVTENITQGGMYAGTPAKPFKEYVRQLGTVKKVQRLEKLVKELQKLVRD